MNLANYMNLTNLELLMALAGGSVVLSFLTLITILFVGRRVSSFRMEKPLRQDDDQWKEWIRESESICLNFSKHLEEKREIGKRLLDQLDERIERLHGLLGEIEGRTQFLSRGLPQKDPYGQILEMAEAGYDSSDIAKRSNVPRGEVDLILGLRKYGQQ